MVKILDVHCSVPLAAILRLPLFDLVVLGDSARGRKDESATTLLGIYHRPAGSLAASSHQP